MPFKLIVAAVWRARGRQDDGGIGEHGTEGVGSIVMGQAYELLMGMRQGFLLTGEL